MTNDIDISPEAVEQLANRLHHQWYRQDAQLVLALSAALTQSRAETAAAYERAAEEIDCCGCNGDCPMPSTCCAIDAKNIRAIATPEQSSALAAIEVAAEARGMRKAAVIAYQFEGNDKLRCAILAAIPQGEMK